jgi:hypothetical protein
MNRMPAFNRAFSLSPPAVNEASSYLNAKLIRLKRISGLYAQTFQTLEQMGVHIPFVGTAAFTSNLVGWELENASGLTLALHPDWSNPMQNQNVPRSPIGLGMTLGSLLRRSSFPIAWTTVNQIFDGNAVVFVEVFAIFDFSIRHFKAFGVPHTETALNDFDECLKAFIKWWDQVQPSNKKVSQLVDIDVDSEGLIHQGIMDSLRAVDSSARLRASTTKILKNEQEITLQRYMYDLVDNGMVDEMELLLMSKGYKVASKFSYYQNAEINEKYYTRHNPISVISGGKGVKINWITEPKTRLPFAVEVVTKFDNLYYDDPEAKAYLQSQHQMMLRDALGY